MRRTITAQPHCDAAPADLRRSRPKRVLLAVVAFAVVLAVASFVVLKYLDSGYGPVEGGSFSGPVSDHGLVFSKDGLSYRLAANPGTTATFIAAIDNSGSHSVHINSIEPPPEVSDVRWSVYHFEPGGDISGVNARWRSFPATIPAHGTIRVLFTVHRPACTANSQESGISVSYDGSLLVRWSSLLRQHRTSAKVLVSPITIC